MKCLKCNKNIPEDARLCPYCATPVTDQQRITQKIYGTMANNLKEFIIKSPIDMKKARVIDWSKNEDKPKPKKPKIFYITIIIILITLPVIIVLLLSGMFK